METSRSTQRDRVFRFGPFELSEREAELRNNGVRIKLQEQSFLVLAELAANAGRVVTREELQQKLWPADTFVDFDVGLNNVIRKLRQTLGDDADNPHYIETIAKRGYRFLAQVFLSSPTAPVAEAAAAPVEAVAPKTRSWNWVLAASVVLSVLVGGAIIVWRGKATTPALATEQRITANSPEAPVTAAVISPDGKYVAYSDSTGVYIRHIDTGETRPLQLPRDFDAVPTSWFPDGTHLLLSTGGALYGIWALGPRGIGTLWRVSLMGGTPQKLIDNASGGTVSPDGSKIAFLHGDVGVSREIWVVGSDGSNPASVVEAATRETSVTAGNGSTNQPHASVSLSGVAWSPDGKRLAYFRRFEPDSPGPSEDKRYLETVEATGGTPKVLKVSRQLFPVACWATDDRLFYGYRDDPASDRLDYGIWSVRVSHKSGDREGKEVQVTRGAGRLGGLSVSADGKRLVLWRDNLAPAVFLTELDTETRRFKRPRRLTLDENPNVVTAWTADSRAVLFSSNRSGTYKLFRQAIDQVVPEVLVEGRNISQPRLSPDGTQVLYLAGYDPEAPAKPVSVMAVPVAGGPPRVVLQTPFIGDIQCARSPSNFCLLVSPDRALSFDPENGKVQPFLPFRGPAAENWSLSPDGSQLALVYRGSKQKITFVTVSDKSRREVELRETLAGGMDWAADSKTVFVTGRATNGSPVVLDVEPSGNYRVLLEGDRAAQYLWAIPSPDGHYWALQEVSGAGNVWMVQDY
jgi:DNA-binding winged helix-turn-helix (wHTH) protein/Tol biopolymer transport system component